MPIMTILALTGKMHWLDRILECIPFILMVKNRTEGTITFKLDYNAILQAVIIGLLVVGLTKWFVKDEIAALENRIQNLEIKTDEQSGLMRQLYLKENR